ncbi:DNA-directed RNA polymerase [Lentilactobacillus fungorum]|uniref:DNA-directed RNA polymerase n=1 Tax=Lentilactobacillus fungorum TaxID=2201250 RepID=A0ABQ3W1Z9_9LACO|nr:sigma-70 family RNA polymerase sigma factor [Lentilactobacillus fungorum]GHP15215.1 DNA-directed RNA polymerase [Lentilactobacillus fungorum]
MITEEEIAIIKLAGQGDSEAFARLFNRYHPVLRKIRRLYFISGMDAEDIEQEARIVLYRSAQKFEPGRNISFGSYYSHNLKNRVFDLIRANNAKKRLPIDALKSIEANESFYEATVADLAAWSPEHLVIVGEELLQLYKSCSRLEKEAFAKMLPNSDPTFKMAAHRSILNAFERCRQKYLDRIN